MTLTASRPLSPAYPHELKSLGDHLRKKRLDLGLLQKDVAHLLDVATDTVTNWEKGRTSPQLHFILKIIEFLGYVPFSEEGKSLGERIVEMRRLLGIRQDELALQVGVDPETLARWEQEIGQPSDRLRAKLVEYLGLER